MRIQFKKGKQREFFQKVLNKTNCPSLKELINRGFDINYSTLKNYFSESRLIPETLFNDLCVFANFDLEEFKIKYLENNWGQIKGGKNKT